MPHPRLLALGLLLTVPLLGARPSPAPLPEACAHPSLPNRLVLQAASYEIEYTPGQEARVQALLAALKDFTTPPAIKPANPFEALSAEVCIQQADTLLQEIAHELGMEQPTEVMQACYLSFLKAYVLWDYGRSIAPDVFEQNTNGKRFAVWDRNEVISRLKAGESLENFSLDEKSGELHFNFAFNFTLSKDQQAELDAQKQNRLDHKMNYEMVDGICQLKARFTLHRNGRLPDFKAGLAGLAADKAVIRRQFEQTKPTRFPVATGLPDGTSLSPEDSVQKALKQLSDVRKLDYGRLYTPMLAPHLFILLHETIEAGIVDRYLGSRDRRWLCDGVANYLAWEIIRRHCGEDAARLCYDLEKELSKMEAFRKQIDLKNWKAVENLDEKEQRAPLNSAHYAFATQAVALMHHQSGPDILPKLFKELGKTPRKKASAKTVAKIYKQLTGKKLDEVLKQAVQAGK